MEGKWEKIKYGLEKAKKWFTVVGRGDNNLRTFFFICEFCQIKSAWQIESDVFSAIVFVTHLQTQHTSSRQHVEEIPALFFSTK